MAGTPAAPQPGQWVQTERKTHEAWARLTAKKPRAAALAHYLVAQMGTQNAVVVSQAVLASLMECSIDTVQRAARDLVAERWIQVIRIGKGKEAAYVINDRVAWEHARADRRLSTFSAAVLADLNDQDEALLGHGDLRRIPTLYPGELQSPHGPGEPPPSQPSLGGLEPDLPARAVEAPPPPPPLEGTATPEDPIKLGSFLASVAREVGPLTAEERVIFENLRDKSPASAASFE